LENFGEWFPQVRSIVSANSLPHAHIDKEYLEVVAGPNGKERQLLVRVKQVKPNLLFVTEGDYPPLLPRMEVTFHPQGIESCIVTWRMYSRNNSLLARFTLLPLARRVIRKRAAVGVARLKKNLESGKI